MVLLSSLGQKVGDYLSTVGATLATAESCTGGLLGSVITDIPGSSAYYRGGVISYSNELKVQYLGVETYCLERFGAVSKETVIQMAEGIRRQTGATYALATSGIAGPGGGSATKPVGLVYIGLAGPKGTRTSENRLSGCRKEIKAQAVQAALEMLIDLF